MNDALETIAGLTPLGAVMVLGGVAATALTQAAKRPGWTKACTERVAVGIAVVIGTVAYVVSGLATVFPPSAVEVVSTGVVLVAGVAVMSRAAYAMLGHAIPDGRALPPENGDARAAADANEQIAELRALLREVDKRTGRDGT